MATCTGVYVMCVVVAYFTSVSKETGTGSQRSDHSCHNTCTPVRMLAHTGIQAYMHTAPHTHAGWMSPSSTPQATLRVASAISQREV